MVVQRKGVSAVEGRNWFAILVKFERGTGKEQKINRCLFELATWHFIRTP